MSLRFGWGKTAAEGENRWGTVACLVLEWRPDAAFDGALREGFSADTAGEWEAVGVAPPDDRKGEAIGTQGNGTAIGEDPSRGGREEGGGGGVFLPWMVPMATSSEGHCCGVAPFSCGCRNATLVRAYAGPVGGKRLGRPVKNCVLYQSSKASFGLFSFFFSFFGVVSDRGREGADGQDGSAEAGRAGRGVRERAAGRSFFCLTTAAAAVPFGGHLQSGRTPSVVRVVVRLHGCRLEVGKDVPIGPLQLVRLLPVVEGGGCRGAIRPTKEALRQEACGSRPSPFLWTEGRGMAEASHRRRQDPSRIMDAA